MVDKNLFPYHLAIAAIFKDEGAYLKEWLDYHLLAGVEHFYLYNNESTDNYAEILEPYIAAGLVTLVDFPGKAMQVPAYDDAVQNYRFECKYIACIDLDEFIFPKSNQKIPAVVDEIFSIDSDVAALGINSQFFGSNNLKAADLSKGVLERFTRRAPDDWTFINEEDVEGGNIYIKSVVNPRLVNCFFGPHYAVYFGGFKSVNARGKETYRAGSHPISTEKIVLNHYYVKSLEEFAAKVNRGSACRVVNHKKMEFFQNCDRNEIFDDGILRYRAARAENFSTESNEGRIRRAEKTLIEILMQCSPFEAPPEFFVDKLETFLTCRALAEKFGTKIDSRSAEEFALAWIYQTLIKSELITHAEIDQFMKALPEILERPFPFCRKLKNLAQNVIIPSFCEELKVANDFPKRSELFQIQKLLRLIK